MALIGDLLVKLNRGETLQPEEEQELILWGNQTQLNNAYVGGLQNGSSGINAKSVLAHEITSNKTHLGGVAYFYWNEDAPSGVYTNLDVTATFVNDDNLFDVSGTTITFNRSGLYLYYIYATTSATDPTIYFTGLDTTITNGIPEVRPYVFRKNENFFMRVTHTTGIDKNFQARVFMWLIHQYEAGITT